MSGNDNPALPGPRRRPTAGGYAIGDEKKARIVAAALHRFGADGFEGASTREIAAEAGVNPPAIQYYFGGKEGLYLACGEHITERLLSAVAPCYRKADGLVPADRAGALDLLCDTLDAIAELLFDTAAEEGWAAFLARSLNKDGDGPRNEVLGRKVEDDLNAFCARLVGLVTGEEPTASATILRAFAVTGQLTTFLFGQAAALRHLGWPDFRGSRLEMLKHVLRRQVTSSLAPDAR